MNISLTSDDPLGHHDSSIKKPTFPDSISGIQKENTSSMQSSNSAFHLASFSQAAQGLIKVTSDIPHQSSDTMAQIPNSFVKQSFDVQESSSSLSSGVKTANAQNPFIMKHLNDINNPNSKPAPGVIAPPNIPMHPSFPPAPPVFAQLKPSLSNFNGNVNANIISYPQGRKDDDMNKHEFVKEIPNRDIQYDPFRPNILKTQEENIIQDNFKEIVYNKNQPDSKDVNRSTPEFLVPIEKRPVQVKENVTILEIPTHPQQRVLNNPLPYMTSSVKAPPIPKRNHEERNEEDESSSVSILNSVPRHFNLPTLDQEISMVQNFLQRFNFKLTCFERLCCKKLGSVEKVQKVLKNKVSLKEIRMAQERLKNACGYEGIIKKDHYSIIHIEVVLFMLINPTGATSKAIEDEKFEDLMRAAHRSCIYCWESRKNIIKLAKSSNADFAVLFIKIATGACKVHYLELLVQDKQKLVENLKTDPNMYLEHFW